MPWKKYKKLNIIFNLNRTWYITLEIDEFLLKVLAISAPRSRVKRRRRREIYKLQYRKYSALRQVSPEQIMIPILSLLPLFASSNHVRPFVAKAQGLFYKDLL